MRTDGGEGSLSCTFGQAVRIGRILAAMPAADPPSVPQTTPTEFERARYARMLWNSPLSEAHAALLLDVLDVRDGQTVVDLGCGWAELLLRAVVGAGDATGVGGHGVGVRGVGIRGVGVDTDKTALTRARGLAAARGLADRVTFDAVPAADWAGTADRVICVGAAHAFGGTVQALRRLHGVLDGNGRLLFGDGIWQQSPGPEALAIFGEHVRPLPDLAEAATAVGWRVLHLSTADQLEWDVFESTWRQGRQEWLLDHPDAPGADDVRAELDRQQLDYLRVYRGVLGFAYLVLGRARSAHMADISSPLLS